MSTSLEFARPAPSNSMAPTSWRVLLVALSAMFVSAGGVPAPSTLMVCQEAIKPLTPAQVAAFKPYTWYASTAYCNASSTKAWNCGENCDSNPTFRPVDSGGDGNETQFCEYQTS